MKRCPANLALAFAVVIVTFDTSWSDQQALQKPTKVSIIIRGAHCDPGVKILRATLGKLKGIKYRADDIEKGSKPKYFTDPFIVEIADTRKTNIGALATVVSEAKTPHRDDVPPKDNLVLYTPDRIDEPSVMALRSSLRDVNGLEVDAPGGLGGFPKRGYYWIQLENAGGAALSDIMTAAKKSGLKLSLQKSPDGGNR